MEVSSQVFDIICRACLTESNNMKSLYTKLEDAGGQLLLDLFKISSNIEFNNTDALPKQICCDCATFLYKFNEFRRRCKESEMILKNVCPNPYNPYFVKTDENIDKFESKASNSCIDKPLSGGNELEKSELINLFANSEISLKKVDPSILDQNNVVKTEIHTENDTIDYSDTFDDREELKIEYEEPKEVKTYKCNCGEEYKSKDKYKQHTKLKNCGKKHKKANKNQEKPIETKNNDLTCPKCDKIFNSISTWSAHQVTHISPKKQKKEVENDEEIPKVQCSLCLRKFKNKKTLSKHIKRHEAKDSVKHICMKCKREFKYKSFLESHMLSVHANGANGYVCEYCPEKFSDRKSLEVHMDNHNKKKNTCPFCNKSFLMLCTLKDHLRIHTGEKPFLCSICGKGFSQKTNLGQHVRRHMGVKPYTCQTCNMGFVSKGELDSHSRKHTGAHPFICDECGSGFTTSSALVKHRRTHTGERPYPCDLCPMKFAATGTLKNHRRTHTGERPYQCSHCEKSFVQRSDLISHIRCHTGERPFVCPQCGQAFRKAAAMKAHVKMHARERQSLTLQSASGMACEGQL